MGSHGRVLDRARDMDDDEAGHRPVVLTAQHPAHPLDHLPPAAARGEHDGDIGGGYVDALVEHLRRGDRTGAPDSNRASTSWRRGWDVRVDGGGRDAMAPEHRGGLFGAGDVWVNTMARPAPNAR